jgi:hypothetical protein
LSFPRRRESSKFINYAIILPLADYSANGKDNFATFFKKSGTKNCAQGQILGRSASKPSKIAILARYPLLKL